MTKQLQSLDPYQQDQQLVERCLLGEVAAWEELYNQCHPPLLVSVRILLGHGQADEDLVDEIAAQVWYALVANDGELLGKYEASRGARLTTFVRTVARDLVGRHFRSERRRVQREKEAFSERPQYQASTVGHPAASLTAFMATLSPTERSFCDDYLLGGNPQTETESPVQDSAESAARESAQTRRKYSAANVRQLSSRIQRKLVEFVRAHS